MEGYTQERLLKSVQAHRGKMTKLITLAETLIGICTASPSRRATQELEKIKRELDDKCLDTEAGLEILARRATEGDAMDKEAATSCLLYTSPSPRDKRQTRMPSSA